jgi:hypothetical protein
VEHGEEKGQTYAGSDGGDEHREKGETGSERETHDAKRLCRADV